VQVPKLNLKPRPELQWIQKLTQKSLKLANTVYTQRAGVREKLAGADAIYTPASPDKPAYLIQITAGSSKERLPPAGVKAVKAALGWVSHVYLAAHCLLLRMSVLRQGAQTAHD
jgi:hypothetical protein